MLPGLKERLLGLINDPAYTPLKKEELALIFDIHPTEMPMFYNFLEELEEDGYIGKTKKGKMITVTANIDLSGYDRVNSIYAIVMTSGGDYKIQDISKTDSLLLINK